MKNLGIGTKNNCVSDLVEKLEHLKYVRPGVVSYTFLAIIMVSYTKLCLLDEFMGF